MARTRAKLTEKQERIIVQCQLMGLTTADMIQISNRLKALEKERDFKVEVNNAIQGKTWQVKKPKNHYIITDSRGKVYECVLSAKTHSYWEGDKWDIVVSHPGTRMKPKLFTKISIYVDQDEVPTVCPDKDKYLYRLCKAINAKRFEK